MAIKIDMDLQAKLKLARRLEMHYVFCPGSKLEEHFLTLSKRKLTKSDHAEARLESDGTKLYFGVVRPDAGSIVFLSKKEVPTSAQKALERVVRQKAGLKSISPRFRTAEDLGDADDDDHEERRGLSLGMRRLYTRKKAVLTGVKKLRQQLPPAQAKKVGRAVLKELNRLSDLAEEANAKDDEAKVQNAVRGLEKLEQRVRGAAKGPANADAVAKGSGKAPKPKPKKGEKPWAERVKDAQSRLRQVSGYGEVSSKTVDQLTRLLDVAQAKAKNDAAMAVKLLGRFEKEADTALAKARG